MPAEGYGEEVGVAAGMCIASSDLLFSESTVEQVRLASACTMAAFLQRACNVEKPLQTGHRCVACTLRHWQDSWRS